MIPLLETVIVADAIEGCTVKSNELKAALTNVVGFILPAKPERVIHPDVGM
jgi:hypothetical protein